VRRPTLLPAVAAVLCLAACSNKPPEETGDYTSRVAAERAAKDAEFLRSSSPIPQSRKSELLPLPYFPIDAAYKVPALLTPSNDNSVFTMPTSTGQPRQERRAGTLEFTVHGQNLRLLAFVEAAATNLDRLFVPFADLTTGKDTYSGGRYIDLARTPTGIYELDFNKAYTPYCYYNPSFECPYPPAENRLPVPIQAGEKVAARDRL
jgi:uncharacterized protein (DUF1684 family)